MSVKTFNVPNISCNHCVMRIQKTLTGLNGVTSAKADATSKTVTAEWDETKVNWETLQAALTKIGYPPENIERQ